MKDYKKTIPTTIKEVIDYKLRTQESKNIYKKTLWDIIDTIESGMNNSENSDNYYSEKRYGNPIPIRFFINNTGRGKDVIKRQLDWLVLHKIIWRSETNKIIETVNDDRRIRYDSIRYEIIVSKLNNFDRFVYTSTKGYECDNLYVKGTDEALDILSDNLESLTIDVEGALKNLSSKYDNIPHTKKILDILDDKKRNDAIKHQQISIKYQSKLVYDIALNNHSIKYGNNVNRIYYTITQLSSKLHNFLYLDGYKLREIDATASQLTLISNITRHIDSEFHTIIDSEQTFYEWLIEKMIISLKSQEETIKLPNEYDFNGYYYNTITKKKRTKSGYYAHNTTTFKKNKDGISNPNQKNKWKYIHYSELTKKVIKPQVFASIFSAFGNNSFVTMIIKNEFGSIVEGLKIVSGVTDKTDKKKIGSIVASHLQNLEAKIWVGALVRLKDLGIKAVIKHDALLYDGAYEVIVKKVVENSFDNNDISFREFNTDDDYVRNINKFSQSKIKINHIEKVTMSDIKKSTSILTFKNKKTNDVYKGTRSDFIVHFGFQSAKSNIAKMINKGLSYKKWEII